ncbi:putative Coenzyme F420 hydrogenase [Methanoculleus bourgensis]|uniref:Putative Coenzyme F420 hydrogenase n=1 Tax=Methanoculleus bourgensis TaxID=83986 RepID=A0A0X3BN59_9EURY|nr:putative Coenzyme F420 hydrogenase [Methanoculleus bourgensis]
MSKVVEISPTTRHEGHSKLVLKVNDEGIVERGDWLSITPVRGVEKLAIGKTMEQVPKIASRVCGICPIAHTLAGIEAMEASIGCEIPEDAKLLRYILQCANRMHSHSLHNILSLPDMYIPGTDTKINPFTKEEPVRSVALRIQRIREIGQTIGEIVGGEAIHPSNPRVGGMYTNITPRAKAKIYDLAKEARVLTQQQMEFMISVFRNYQKRDWSEVGGVEVPIPDDLGYHNQGYMAVAPVYGSSSSMRTPPGSPSGSPKSAPGTGIWARWRSASRRELPHRWHHPRRHEDLAPDGGLHRCPALRRAAGRGRTACTSGPVQELR